MKFIDSFIPNHYNEDIDDLLNILDTKFSFIIFDFDNTLMPWGSSSISKDVSKLLSAFMKHGTKIFIITNGSGERIETLQKSIPKHIKILDDSKNPG